MKVDDASSDSVSECEELTKVQNINLFCFFVVVFFWSNVTFLTRHEAIWKNILSLG